MRFVTFNSNICSIDTYHSFHECLLGFPTIKKFENTDLQAKSPIRTLDELTVTEVAPCPYFPTVLERKQSDNGMDVSLPSSDKSKVNALDPIQDIGQGFGTRRRHRCFVVTARARSFLYHQVTFLINICAMCFFSTTCI